MTQQRRPLREPARRRNWARLRDRVRYRDLFVLDPSVTIDTITDETVREAARASLEAEAWAPRWLLYLGAIAMALGALWIIDHESDLVLLVCGWATLVAAAALAIQTARAPSRDDGGRASGG